MDDLSVYLMIRALGALLGSAVGVMFQMKTARQQAQEYFLLDGVAAMLTGAVLGTAFTEAGGTVLEKFGVSDRQGILPLFGAAFVAGALWPKWFEKLLRAQAKGDDNG